MAVALERTHAPWTCKWQNIGFVSRARMCRSRPEWVDPVRMPGLVTCCEKVCRLFRHHSDLVFCSQRCFPEIFQISVTGDQAYESPICYAMHVFASLLGDVATGCERKKKILLLTIQLFSVASEIILHFDISVFSTMSPECSPRRKTWINQCKIYAKNTKWVICLGCTLRRLLVFCVSPEKNLPELPTTFNFDLTNSQPRGIVSTSIHVPVRSYFWLYHNTTVFIL